MKSNLVKMETPEMCCMQYVNECSNKLNTKYVMQIIIDHNTNQSYDKYFCSDACMNQFNKKEMCQMQYINKCPKKSKKMHRVQTTSYYRNRGYENYFCGEECMDQFGKYHKCQKCSYAGDLIISKKDNLAYCTSKEYWDQSCHEKHMGLSGVADRSNMFIDKFIATIYDNENDFNLDSLTIIKERIDEILDDKINNTVS